MKPYLNKNGVTLIELVAILVILGIIAGIGFLTIGNIIANSRIRAYEETTSSLNTATEFYALSENIYTDDIFEGLDSNSQRLTILFTHGYLSLLPQPVTPYSYDWDIETQTWILESEEVIVVPEENVEYDFETSRLVEIVEDGGLVTSGSFSDTGTSIDSTYGLLFINNPNETYTITVSAALTEGTSGGYGIFFETYLNEDSDDTGYILQFDRGYDNGEILIKPRTNGSEGNAVFKYPVGFDDDGDGDFVTSGGTKNRTNPWWTETHELKLVIELTGDSYLNKIVSVYLDDVFLFDYTFKSKILPGEEDLNKTGFRVWSLQTIFYSLEIS